jgi:hypothetical protein
MIDGIPITYNMIYGLQLLGVLNSVDQLPKEAPDGGMYIVSEKVKVNVHGDMINAITNTTYVRSSGVWMVFQKETIQGG